MVCEHNESFLNISWQCSPEAQFDIYTSVWPGYLSYSVILILGQVGGFHQKKHTIMHHVCKVFVVFKTVYNAHIKHALTVITQSLY